VTVTERGAARRAAGTLSRLPRRAIVALMRGPATRRLLVASLRLPFDPFDPAFRADPYPAFHRLRGRAPVYRTPFGFWLVSSHAEAVQVLNDARFVNYDYRSAPRSDRRSGADASFKRGAAVFLNPPDHGRIRRSLAGILAPSRVEALRERVEAHAHRLLDDVGHLRRVDIAAAFATRLPVAVVGDLFGLPAEDAERCYSWGRQAFGVLSIAATGPERLRGQQSLTRLMEFFRDALDARRAGPRGDVLTEIALLAKADGGLTEDECVANAVLLFVAGFETTVGLLATSILTLLRNPVAWDALRSDPRLARATVEEALRYESPFQFFGREAREDVAVGGVPIARGQTMFVLAGAANRDPAAFPEPDRFDPGRRSAHHLAFGHGPHACLGQALARLEGEIALRILAERRPGLRLAGPPPVWRDDFQVRAIDSLVVDW
jgi:cytochrome P450